MVSIGESTQSKMLIHVHTKSPQGKKVAARTKETKRKKDEEDEGNEGEMRRNVLETEFLLRL